MKFLPSTLTAKYDSLTDKDRRALMFLTIFALLMLVYGVFLLHSKATKAQNAAMSAQKTLFWLRAQAPLVAAQKPVSTDAIERVIQDRAGAQGVSVSVVENANRAQVSAQHSSAAVLGNVFAGLSADGLVVEQLTLTQQPDKTVLAEAVVSRAG